MGRDHTLHSLIDGHVRFTHTNRPWRTGVRAKRRTYISVVPHGQVRRSPFLLPPSLLFAKPTNAV
jgi:hypothetical protein